MNKLSFTALMLLICGCNATTPPPYEKNIEPEDRTYYSGKEGLAQHQKDQKYLLTKELSDKCETAKVNLAIAEQEKNKKETIAQKRIIKQTCR